MMCKFEVNYRMFICNDSKQGICLQFRIKGRLIGEFSLPTNGQIEILA